ncbi:90 kDa surface protein [Trypanosoma cruzi]|nr:90 kDa surface protein [Trypanosoma cruzi]
MCDVFPFCSVVLLPARGAGLIAVRPTDCTKGGLEEQAGCRMECEGCCVAIWNRTIFFNFISLLGEGNMYKEKHGCLMLLSIRNKSAAPFMFLKVLGVLLDSHHFSFLFCFFRLFKFWFVWRCASFAVVMIPSIFFGVRFLWLLPFITMRWLYVV